MQLGIIGRYDRESFEKAKARNLAFLEFDINDHVEDFVSKADETLALSRETGVGVGAVGRWGGNRCQEDGTLSQQELDWSFQLIETAARLGSPVFITGINYVQEKSYYQNITTAIDYFQRCLAYGKKYGVRVCAYNCDWNNFIYSDPNWELVLGELPELGIKYDPTHCIARRGDYLAEAAKWAKRFYHVHIKGSVMIGDSAHNGFYDNPPAGMDQINWGAFMSILYANNYEGNLSIEPHSGNWLGERGEKGVDFTVQFIKQLLF